MIYNVIIISVLCVENFKRGWGGGEIAIAKCCRIWEAMDMKIFNHFSLLTFQGNNRGGEEQITLICTCTYMYKYYQKTWP